MYGNPDHLNVEFTYEFKNRYFVTRIVLWMPNTDQPSHMTQKSAKAKPKSFWNEQYAI